jgi:hypothetical protein
MGLKYFYHFLNTMIVVMMFYIMDGLEFRVTKPTSRIEYAIFYNFGYIYMQHKRCTFIRVLS